MAWNLFLAWLPLLWAGLLVRGLKKKQFTTPKNILWAGLWLAFLPNTFYLVTDYIHLRRSLPSTILFDAVMLTAFALVGIVLGCTSIYFIHLQLAKRLRRNAVWAILLTCFALSSLAIYLGRYLGWNSWDLALNPFYILLDLSDRLTSIDGLSVTAGTTVLFFCFISATYAAFYSAIKAVRIIK